MPPTVVGADVTLPETWTEPPETASCAAVCAVATSLPVMAPIAAHLQAVDGAPETALNGRVGLLPSSDADGRLNRPPKIDSF